MALTTIVLGVQSDGSRDYNRLTLLSARIIVPWLGYGETLLLGSSIISWGSHVLAMFP